MNDAYRILCFIIVPLLIVIGYLMPDELEVTVCKIGQRVTYVHQRRLSEETINQLGLGSCEQLAMKREDYYKVRNSRNF